jgi:D-sedoheptulose 7-phosphate isomerase
MNIDELKKCIDDIDKDDLVKLENIINNRKNIIIIGNGGSNAVASHISQDYTKALGKRALSFSDSSRLTCYMNDYGVEQAYIKFIEHFAYSDTLIILISSSGNSLNIINSVEYCNNSKLDVITLSGFDKDNKLNQLSNNSILHFWVNSNDYGIVECTHEIILHSII